MSLELEIKKTDEFLATCEIVEGKLVETETRIFESAKCLQQLGIIYLERINDPVEKWNEKRNVIKSAGLLFAAKTRKEQDFSIDCDIGRLWVAILAESEAVNKNVPLSEITNEIKNRVQSLREMVEENLNSIEQIGSNLTPKNLSVKECKKTHLVFDLLTRITNSYINIMQVVARKCIFILFGVEYDQEFAAQFFDFAILALGSLSRKEGTHYSDFENIIVLGDETPVAELEFAKERCRWLSVIFQVILISLCESPIGLLGISSLTKKENPKYYDVFTKCGIQYDSNTASSSVFPLGPERPQGDTGAELVRTVTEMTELLQHELNRPSISQRQYHLSEALSNSAFVFGSQKLFELYQDKVTATLDDIHVKKKYLNTMRNSLQQFDTINEIAISGEQENIKTILYRHTLLINFFGRYNGVYSSQATCILQKLVEKRIISAAACHNLKYALAVICEIRLRAFEGAKQQVPYVKKVTESNGEVISGMLELIGKTSMVDTFRICNSFWNALLPILLGIEDIDSLSEHTLREHSDDIDRALLTSLGLANDFPQQGPALTSPHLIRYPFMEPVLLDFAKYSKVVAVTLLKLIKKTIKVGNIRSSEIKKNAPLENLVIAKNMLVGAANRCNEAIENRNRNSVDQKSPYNVARQMFCDIKADEMTADMMSLVRLVETLKHVVTPNFRDYTIVKAFPEILYFIYSIAQFTTLMRGIISENREKMANANNCDLLQNELDQVLTTVTSLKTAMDTLSQQPYSYILESAFDLLVKQKQIRNGLFSFDDLLTGLEKWAPRTEATRNNLISMKIEKRLKALNDAQSVISFTQGVGNWSFLVKRFAKVVMKDVDLAIADIYFVKAEHFDRIQAHEKVQELCSGAIALKTLYPRVKNGQHRNIKSIMEFVAISMYKQGKFVGAIRAFEHQLNYHYEHMKDHRSTAQVVKDILAWQRKCYEALEEAERKGHYDFVVSELD